MFSFHKPKIYRSVQGCCICRAKSSSSRFTDSKRYEADFEKCFNIDENRRGEICNACVLLVKRWKKLPKGSLRNWEHVVDARAGPGTKSMNKIKNKAAGVVSKDPLKEERFKKKHKHKHSKKHIVKQMQASQLGIIKAPGSPSQFSDDIGDDCMSEDMQSYDADYLSNSDASDGEYEDSRSTSETKSSIGGRRRKVLPTALHVSSFLDLNYWKRTEICCGIIFKGANGECLLDTSLWRPCRTCKVSRSGKTITKPVHSAVIEKPLEILAPSVTSATSITSLGYTQPSAPPTSGGYADTNPPAPVEIEPMSFMSPDQAPSSPMIAHTPMDSQTECASDMHSSYLSASALDNLSVDNLTLPQHQASLSPLMQTSPRFIHMQV